ncbi:Probable phosphomannomutase [Eumeta japonica]|uniref:Phosphomannomutase n=1 Tax=Eumeta variegata TaxID=151549 RepID=A0A4C1UXT8_EUMVA|nr:Probable phosphomannomutase [Eumeta japonica]
MAPLKNILYLFDVDGTLTKSRQIIKEEVRNFLFQELSPRGAVGIVSGSDFAKVSEQMGGAEVLSQFDYVFCENGLMYYRKGELINKKDILEYMGEQKLQKVINFCLGYLSKLELPAKRGTFIEFRSGMINVSPVGRSCSQEEREQFAAYDVQHKVREAFVEALKKEFSDFALTFALGGQISIDIFPEGWDKTYCLNHVENDNFSEIHFFGDKTDLGGNDCEIYNDARTIGHKVMTPEDTIVQLKKLLSLS